MAATRPAALGGENRTAVGGRRGDKKALVAVAHSILVIAYHLLRDGQPYRDLGARVIRQRDSARENRLNAWLYHRNADHYRRGLHRAWDGAEYEAWLAAKQAEVARDEDLA